MFSHMKNYMVFYHVCIIYAGVPNILIRKKIRLLFGLKSTEIRKYGRQEKLSRLQLFCNAEISGRVGT